MNEGSILTIRQAAKKFGVSHETVAAWTADGLVRVHTRPAKRGQAMLVFSADVEKLVKAPVGNGRRGHRERLRDYLAAS